MNIWHTRYGASNGFGATVLAGGISIDSVARDDTQGCGPADGISTQMAEGGSFDPEAIELMQAVLDEAWASFLPARRAGTSRTIVAKRVLRPAGFYRKDDYEAVRLLYRDIQDAERRSVVLREVSVKS